ncbi:MAG TPA: hypothetical protein VF610_00635, partial [Segetibacter sp.]
MKFTKIEFASVATMLFLTALIGCKTARQATVSKQYTITITNPSAIERADELVVLTRATIEKKTGLLAKGRFVN